MGMINKIIKVLIVISIILLVISYFQKDNLPGQNVIVPELMQEPVQTQTAKKPFQYTQKDISYTITPQYDYEIYGLVVSQNDNEVWYSRFKKDDPSNTKDYCVIWGKNLSSDTYQKIEFYTEEFVCFAKFKDSEQYGNFSIDKLSNNHLITADENTYRAIRSASTGDQIHLKGYLVNYEHIDSEGKKQTRGTSISRTDEGMGACETIYVEQFEILKKGNALWWFIFKISPYAIAILSFLLIIFSILDGRSKPQKPPEMPNKDLLLPNYSHK